MSPRLLAIFLTLALHSGAQEPEPTVEELRETIAKIVDTQSMDSAELLGWEARKAEMAALLDLHRRELTLLDEELGKAGQSAPSHEEATAEMKAKIEALKQTRRLTAEAVARNVPRMIALAQRFPDPLLADSTAELAALNEWKPADEPREALRSILALLSKAEQFNRRLTRTTAIRDNREVQVLYLGLAQAFYTDRKEKAGIGKPAPDGWKWTAQPAILNELNTALDTLDKKHPPTMVRLPLEIQ